MAISLYYIFIYNNQKVTNIREMAIKDFFLQAHENSEIFVLRMTFNKDFYVG